jgi:hypothetical protein
MRADLATSDDCRWLIAIVRRRAKLAGSRRVQSRHWARKLCSN